ncbi:MAG: Gfo/Idh/MocA family oxidoreductase [Planctomycetota bacterium]|nr:Gfo/Idh/MocA family oxidoreductase [Planctomycetota bacterium]
MSPIGSQIQRRITRRQFAQGSAVTLFALGLPSLAYARRPRRSPNEEIRVAVAGIRSRGRNHINGFHSLPNVRVVALCDVDRAFLEKEARAFEERGEKVALEVDFRRILERDDVDVVSIATPNHWHSLQAIWACQAGKDVYLEKPVSHNVWEGGRIVAAARKYGRIVQTGTQARSSQGIAEAIAWLHAGNLGKIEVARGLCYKPRPSIGKVDGPQKPPATVDYDLWTGPAPLKPLMRARLHYDWHWVYDTGNGDVGNQGIHQMDLARWALGETELAPSVMSVGGRFGYDDDGNTPNTQMVVHGYARAPLIFEVRGLPRSKAKQAENWGAGMDTYMGARIGVIVHCEKGHLLIPDYSQATAFDEAGEPIETWKGSSDHFANFIGAVRSRNVDDLSSDIREGHVSSALCHMGNVSHLLGTRMPRDEIAATMAENPAAAETYERFLAHLDANKIDLAKAKPVLGPTLALDPKSERFGTEAANRLLARDYREPFVVPEKV